MGALKNGDASEPALWSLLAPNTNTPRGNVGCAADDAGELATKLDHASGENGKAAPKTKGGAPSVPDEPGRKNGPMLAARPLARAVACRRLSPPVAACRRSRRRQDRDRESVYR